MRRIALVALVGACSSDPSLAVSVTHPAGLDVAKTTVTVYESDQLHCTDIEFDKLDAAALAALASDEVDLPGDLSGISRTHHKVIVARGYDVSGDLLSIGCADKDEVIGADAVAITTAIAVMVSVRTPGDANLEVAVTLTDRSGASIADARPISWTAYGPAGSMGANASNLGFVSDGVWEPTLPTCTANGVAMLHPNPPSSVGGYAIQIRAAWAVDQPQPYTQLATNAFGLTMLGITPSTEARRWCAIRVKGALHRLVCVDNNHMAYDYAITVANGRASAMSMGSQPTLPPLGGGNKTVALIAVPTGDDREVYAISDRGFFVPLFGATASASPTTGIDGGLSDAVVAPPCGSVPGRVLLAGVGGNVHQTDLRGGSDMTFGAPIGASATTQIRLDNAGCITKLATSGAPSLTQFATLHTQGLLNNVFGPTGTFLIDCNGPVCNGTTATALTRGAATGFTGGTEPRAVFTSVDASGVVLVQVVLSPTNNLVERSRMPAAALPDRLVVGQFDTDTGSDLFWDIVNRASGTNFELGYARKVGDTNLAALSRPIDTDVGDLLSGDLDGDALDDLVIVTTGGISIVPMGAPLPAGAANPDPTCMP